MNLRQVEAFYWLAEMQNYQRVADKLNISQPAVSARIAALETTLGAALVDRNKAHFALTEAGHDVLVYAERMLDLRDSMLRRVDSDQPEQHRLKIAAVSLSVMTWFPRVYACLQRDYPSIICDIVSASDHQLMHHVSSADVDIAFLSNTPPNMQITKLFTVNYDVRWVGHADLIDTDRQVYHAPDIAALPVIQYPRTSPLYPITESYVTGNPNAGGPRHSANAIGAIVDMLKSGLGVAAIPAVAVSDELESGRLRVIPVANPPRVLQVRCAYANMARRELIDDLVRTAADCAADYCAAHPEWTRYVAGE